ncbi:MAG: sigma-70 domain-containing protein [Candidatus Choladocola sp.]|nr:sigma-70 domain-containing protein [Candidatus Choladocola sp.]
MENKIIFREMLTEIKNEADAAGGIITREKIKEILKNLPLEEEHFQLIYDYLAEQNIHVLESEVDAQELPEGKNNSLSLYVEELMRMEQEVTEDENELFHQVMREEEGAKARLIEWYLPMICDMANEYEGEEIPLEDLIQEGNLGLLTAMETLGEYDSPAACRAHILNSINEAMENAIRSGQENRKMGDGIVSRVNHLNEAVKNLERDLEHKVSAEELSAYLEMPLEEIRDILRMSGDQIEVEGENSR